MSRLKPVSILVLIAFFGQTISVEAAALSAPHSPAFTLESLLETPHSISVPADAARVREVYKGSNGRLIVHIQDAHSNLGAQKNLAKTIDAIAARYGVGLVLVEGSSRDVTLDWLKPALEPAARERFAKQLLQRGAISGEEYLNLTSDRGLRLVGLEDRALYDRGLRIYERVTQVREELIAFCESVENAVEALKARHYPKALVGYEHGAASRGFARSIDDLLALAENFGVPRTGEEIAKLETVRSGEKEIDFEKLNAGLAERGGKPDASSPEWAEYQAYLDSADAIDPLRLLEETVELEHAVYDLALTESDVRILRGIDRYAGLLKKAYSVRLGSRDFETLRANRPDFPSRSWISFLNRKLVEAGLYDRLVPDFEEQEKNHALVEDFYRIVGERDLEFVRRADEAFSSSGERAAYVIAGGYHTEHLTELWREAGYSYVVLSPNVTDETDLGAYEKFLFAPLKRDADTYRKLGLGEPGGWTVLLDDGRVPSRLPALDKEETAAVYRAIALREASSAPAGARRARSDAEQAEIDSLLGAAGVSEEDMSAYGSLLERLAALVSKGGMDEGEIKALHGLFQRLSDEGLIDLLEKVGYKDAMPADKSARTYEIDLDPALDAGWLSVLYREWLAGNAGAPQTALKVRADVWNQNPAYTVRSAPESDEDSAVENQIFVKFDVDAPYVYVIPNVNERRRLLGVAVYAVTDPAEETETFRATGVDANLTVAEVLKLSRESSSRVKELFFPVRSGRVLSQPFIPSRFSKITQAVGAASDRPIPQIVGRVFDSAGSLIEKLLNGGNVHYHPRVVVDPLLAKENGHWVVPALAIGEFTEEIGDVRIVEFSSGSDLSNVAESVVKYSHSRKAFPQYFDASAPLRVVVLTDAGKVEKIRADFDTRHNPFGYSRGADYEIVSVDEDLARLAELRNRLAAGDASDVRIGMIDRLNSVVLRLRDRSIGRPELIALEQEMYGFFLNLGMMRFIPGENDAPGYYEIIDHAVIGPQEFQLDAVKYLAQEKPLQLDAWVTDAFERLINSDGPDGEWKAYYTTEQLVFMRENVKAFVELSRGWLQSRAEKNDVLTFRGVVTTASEAVRVFDLSLQALLTELEHYVPSSRYHLIGDSVKFPRGESVETFRKRAESAPGRVRRRATGDGPEKPREHKPAPAPKPERPAPQPEPKAEALEKPQSPEPGEPAAAAPVSEEPQTETPAAPETAAEEKSVPGEPAAPAPAPTVPAAPKRPAPLDLLRNQPADVERVRRDVTALAEALGETERAELLAALEAAAGDENSIALALRLAGALRRNATDPRRRARAAESLETLLDSLEEPGDAGARASFIAAAISLRRTALEMHASAPLPWPPEFAQTPMDRPLALERALEFARRMPASYANRSKFIALLPLILSEEFLGTIDDRTFAGLLFHLFSLTGAANPMSAGPTAFVGQFRRNFLDEAPVWKTIHSPGAEIAEQNGPQAADRLVEAIAGRIVAASQEDGGRRVVARIVPGSSREEILLASAAAAGSGLVATRLADAVEQHLQNTGFTVTGIKYGKIGSQQTIAEFTVVFDTPLEQFELGRVESYVFTSDITLTQGRVARIGQPGKIGTTAKEQQELAEMLRHPSGYSVRALPVYGFESDENAETFSVLNGLEPRLLAASSEIAARRQAERRRREREAAERAAAALAQETERQRALVEELKTSLRNELEDHVAAFHPLAKPQPKSVAAVTKQIDAISAEDLVAGISVDAPGGISSAADKRLAAVAQTLRERIAALKPSGTALAKFVDKLHRSTESQFAFDTLLNDVTAQSAELDALEEQIKRLAQRFEENDENKNGLAISLAILTVAAQMNGRTPPAAQLKAFFERESEYESAYWIGLMALLTRYEPAMRRADMSALAAVGYSVLKAAQQRFPAESFTEQKAVIEKIERDIVRRTLVENEPYFASELDKEIAAERLTAAFREIFSGFGKPPVETRLGVAIRDKEATANAQAVMDHVNARMTREAFKTIRPKPGRQFAHTPADGAAKTLNAANLSREAPWGKGRLQYTTSLFSQFEPLLAQADWERLRPLGLSSDAGSTRKAVGVVVTSGDTPVVWWAAAEGKFFDTDGALRPWWEAMTPGRIVVMAQVPQPGQSADPKTMRLLHLGDESHSLERFLTPHAEPSLDKDQIEAMRSFGYELQTVDPALAERVYVAFRTTPFTRAMPADVVTAVRAFETMLQTAFQSLPADARPRDGRHEFNVRVQEFQRAFAKLSRDRTRVSAVEFRAAFNELSTWVDVHLRMSSGGSSGFANYDRYAQPVRQIADANHWYKLGVKGASGTKFYGVPAIIDANGDVSLPVTSGSTYFYLNERTGDAAEPPSLTDLAPGRTLVVTPLDKTGPFFFFKKTAPVSSPGTPAETTYGTIVRADEDVERRVAEAHAAKYPGPHAAIRFSVQGRVVSLAAVMDPEGGVHIPEVTVRIPESSPDGSQTRVHAEVPGHAFDITAASGDPRLIAEIPRTLRLFVLERDDARQAYRVYELFRHRDADPAQTQAPAPAAAPAPLRVDEDPAIKRGIESALAERPVMQRFPGIERIEASLDDLSVALDRFFRAAGSGAVESADVLATLSRLRTLLERLERPLTLDELDRWYEQWKGIGQIRTPNVGRTAANRRSFEEVGRASVAMRNSFAQFTSAVATTFSIVSPDGRRYEVVALVDAAGAVWHLYFGEDGVRYQNAENGASMTVAEAKAHFEEPQGGGYRYAALPNMPHLNGLAVFTKAPATPAPASLPARRTQPTFRLSPGLPGAEQAHAFINPRPELPENRFYVVLDSLGEAFEGMHVYAMEKNGRWHELFTEDTANPGEVRFASDQGFAQTVAKSGEYVRGTLIHASKLGYTIYVTKSASAMPYDIFKLTLLEPEVAAPEAGSFNATLAPVEPELARRTIEAHAARRGQALQTIHFVLAGKLLSLAALADSEGRVTIPDVTVEGPITRIRARMGHSFDVAHETSDASVLTSIPSELRILAFEETAGKKIVVHEVRRLAVSPAPEASAERKLVPARLNPLMGGQLAVQAQMTSPQPQLEFVQDGVSYTLVGAKYNGNLYVAEGLLSGVSIGRLRLYGTPEEILDQASAAATLYYAPTFSLAATTANDIFVLEKTSPAASVPVSAPAAGGAVSLKFGLRSSGDFGREVHRTIDQTSGTVPTVSFTVAGKKVSVVLLVDQASGKKYLPEIRKDGDAARVTLREPGVSEPAEEMTFDAADLGMLAAMLGRFQVFVGEFDQVQKTVQIHELYAEAAVSAVSPADAPAAPAAPVELKTLRLPAEDVRELKKNGFVPVQPAQDVVEAAYRGFMEDPYLLSMSDEAELANGLETWLGGIAPGKAGQIRTALRNFLAKRSRRSGQPLGDLIRETEREYGSKQPTAFSAWLRLYHDLLGIDTMVARVNGRPYSVLALKDADGVLYFPVVNATKGPGVSRSRVQFRSADGAKFFPFDTVWSSFTNGTNPLGLTFALHTPGEDNRIAFFGPAAPETARPASTPAAGPRRVDPKRQNTGGDLIVDLNDPKLKRKIAAAVGTPREMVYGITTISGDGYKYVAAMTPKGKLYTLELKPHGVKFRMTAVSGRETVPLGEYAQGDADVSQVLRNWPAEWRLFAIPDSAHVPSPVRPNQIFEVKLARAQGARAAARNLLDRPFGEVRVLTDAEISGRDAKEIDNISRQGARALKAGVGYPVRSFEVADAAFMYRVDGTSRAEAPVGTADRSGELAAWADQVNEDFENLAWRVEAGAAPGAVVLDLDEFVAEGLTASRDESFALALPQVDAAARRLSALGFSVHLAGSAETRRVAIAETKNLASYFTPVSAGRRSIHLLRPARARAFEPGTNEGALVISNFKPVSGEVQVRDAIGEMIAAAEMSLVSGRNDQVDEDLARRIAERKGLDVSSRGEVRGTLTDLAQGELDDRTIDAAERLVTLPYRLAADLVEAAFLRARLRTAFETSA